MGASNKGKENLIDLFLGLPTVQVRTFYSPKKKKQKEEARSGSSIFTYINKRGVPE